MLILIRLRMARLTIDSGGLRAMLKAVAGSGFELRSAQA